MTVTSATTLTIVTTGLYLLDATIGYSTSSTTTCLAWIGTPDFVTSRWTEISIGRTVATTPSIAVATSACLTAGTQVSVGVWNYAVLAVSNGYQATHLAVTLLRR